MLGAHPTRGGGEITEPCAPFKGFHPESLPADEAEAERAFSWLRGAAPSPR